MTNLERLIFYYGAGRLFVPRPRYFIYSATSRCDLNCRHCGIWESKKREELATDDLEKIINREFFNRVETAWVSGGEPTLKEGLGRNRKSFPGQVSGHDGFRDCEQWICDRTDHGGGGRGRAELAPSRQGLFLHLSLDGMGEVHDRVRGRKGAFSGLQATVEELTRFRKNHPEVNLEFGFNCVIQPANIDNLEAIKNFADNCHASITFNMVEVTDQIYASQSRGGELTLQSGGQAKSRSNF